MSSILPYLPPIATRVKNLQDVATSAAEDVRAASGAAATTGTAVRGALGTLPAVLPAVNDVVGAPFQTIGRFAVDQAGSFLSHLWSGPTATASKPAPPATQLPVIAPESQGTTKGTSAPAAAPATNPGTLSSSRQGNAVTITGDGTAPAPTVAPAARVVFRSNPVAEAMAMQARYAESQRQAVLAAAEEAAAAGHPGNASYRYAAALGALPTLSGTNNPAASMAQLEAERIQSGERERSNIRTTAESRRATEERAKEVRRNLQPVVISEEVNPDPTTRVFAPTIKRYGFVEKDEATGKIVVRDMTGKQVNDGAQPAAGPAVGAKVKQKDGTYPLEGGRTAVVKGGVIVEIK